MPNDVSTDPIVLIIEDVASEAMTLEAMCRHFGFGAVCAGSPAEAGAILDMLTPTAVVTDLVMPEADGLDGLFMLARRIPDVPVMIVTSSERVLLKAAAELAEHYGLKDLVCAVKPVGVGALGSFLKRAPRRAAQVRAEAE